MGLLRPVVVPLLAAVLFASCGGAEQEIISPSSPTSSVEADPSEPPIDTPSPDPCGVPAATPVTKDTLWRWANVTVIIAAGSPVVASGTTLPTDKPEGRRGMILAIFSEGESFPRSTVTIDADTAEILGQEIKPEDQEALDKVLSTLQYAPVANSDKPWPHTGDPSRDLRRERIENIVIIYPNPAADIVIGGGMAEGRIGSFIEIHNGRSFVFVKTSDGTILGADRILDEDKAAFQRYLDSILIGAEADSVC
jgi:hypothetical protein